MINRKLKEILREILRYWLIKHNYDGFTDGKGCTCLVTDIDLEGNDFFLNCDVFKNLECIIIKREEKEKIDKDLENVIDSLESFKTLATQSYLHDMLIDLRYKKFKYFSNHLKYIERLIELLEKSKTHLNIILKEGTKFFDKEKE